MGDFSTAVLLSEFAEALHGRRVRLVDREDRGSPLHAYAQAHRRLFRQLSTTIDLVEEMEVAREAEEWGSCKSSLPQRAADTAQDLYYRATELFDLYASDLPHFLETKGAIDNSYRFSIKTIRDYWGTICNRCKHNHRFFIPLEVAYEDGSHATGFSVYGRTGSFLSPDERSLRGVDAISYNWLFRRLIGSVVVADRSAAQLASALQENTELEPLASGSYELPYGTLLKKIAARSDLGMPKEVRLPSISLEKDNVNVAFDKVLPPFAGDVTMRLWFDFLGSGVAFQIPYTRGDVTAQISAPGGVSKPLGAFLRIELANLLIKP